MGATMVKNGNLLDALPSQGTLHVVMLGLDSAGKSTALYRMKFDQYLNTVPTIGFNCEKVQGAVGKAKGVHFLIWDVGGQEKLRPLWRSYTRCTDGILFVVDSVDTERMEEAKMELMRTAKCPDNQGVPVLILANKQDLPNACDAKQLEILLGLHELHQPAAQLSMLSQSSSSTGNLAGYSSKTNQRYASTTSQQTTCELSRETEDAGKAVQQSLPSAAKSSPTPTSNSSSSHFIKKHPCASGLQLKGWFIQPACAITGEGLQEGLDALYDMILKRRKVNKSQKKKR